MNVRDGQNTILGLTLRERVMIALVSALIISAKFFFRVPLHIPGHSGFFWMALMVIGVGLVNRRGAGLLIGLLTGILATALIPGRQGIFVGLKYFVPGLLFEVLTPLLGGRLDRPAIAGLIAAFANVGKLATAYVIGLLAGVPGGFLALGLGAASTTHLLFGAIGGVVGAFVLGRLQRAGLGVGSPGVVAVRDVTS